MIINEYTNIGIEGIAGAVPSNYISIESLKNGENNAILDKFVKTTSVTGHYECGPRQTASDLGFISAKEILNRKEVSADKVGVLVYVTQYPDYKAPSTACVLQHRLGLSADCIAFDVNLGCSGFVYGLNVVASLLASGNAEYGLLIIGDTPSKGVRHDNSRNLFGDGSSAVLLKKGSANSGMSFASRTDGSGFKAILRPFGFAKHPDKPDTEGVFNEIDVFNFAISEAPSLINEFMAQRKVTSADFDCIALHQANMMIMKQICKRTKFDKEKMLVSIDTFANTSGASIPLSIVKAYGNVDEFKEINCLICGYGVGLSWAVGIIKFNLKDVYPLVETDEYFDDGLYEK